MITVLVAIVLGLLAVLYFRNTRNHGMFKSGGIFEPPKYFPFGSEHNWKVMLGKVHFVQSLKELYQQYAKDHKCVGVFENSRPVLVINDLDLAKHILIKDFDHFTNLRSMALDTSVKANEYAASMMINLTGEKWKKVRSLMSPAFTSGKLKAMIPMIKKVSEELVQHLESLAKSQEEFSAKDVTVSFTLDCIASSGFGVEANSFKDPDNQFRKMVLQATGGVNGRSTKLMINFMLSIFLPQLASLLKLSFFDQESLEFFGDVIKKAVAHRTKENIRRGDLIDLILEGLKASDKTPEPNKEYQFERDAAIKSSDYKISSQEKELLLISNVIILFFAGYDTTSSSLALTFGYLAKHQDIQEKLYQEINDAMEAAGNRDLDNDIIQSLPYLDKVFMETLRIYFSTNLERECSRDYKLPGYDFVVPKGMLVQIPAPAIHKDRQFYPDPENFNPDENFSEDAKANRSPYAVLPFGQGPRGCIGMRLGLMMAKTCLVKVLANFKVLEGSKMPKEFILGASSFNGMPDGGVWCKVERRSS